MLKKVKNCLRRLASSERMKMLAFMLLVGTTVTFAQSAAGDYSQGTTALTTVTEEIAKYVPYVVKLCYAIAGVVAVVGAISVYITMTVSKPISRCLLSIIRVQGLSIHGLLDESNCSHHLWKDVF